MLTFLSEIKFWTLSNDIVTKDTDYSAFKYHTKKDMQLSSYESDKRDYAEKRDVTYILDNKPPIKLRNRLKKLEQQLKTNQIVHCRWNDNRTLQLFLANGLLIHICLNVFTGDIIRIAFDKFFLGKLQNDTITDVIITRMHILISYTQNQITIVYLQKPNVKPNVPEKISRMEPKIYNLIINGPQNRRIPRQLICNNSYDLIGIWTKSSQNEVYPWRPTFKDQDHANIHIYKLSRTKLESICYYWTENDPINIEFSKLNPNQLYAIEQKISKKGDVSIEICVYEINKIKLVRIAVTSIPLQTQVCCNAFSPDSEKLMLGCIDGSVVIFDINRGITHLVKAAFIPTLVSWHCDSTIIVVGNERCCQLQCFDISLSCIKNQLLTEEEDLAPSNLLDLSIYFRQQHHQHNTVLQRILWQKKPELILHNDNQFIQTDCYLLIMFEHGPIGCLRLIGGAGLIGDIYSMGFTADMLIHQYIEYGQIEKAINLLLCINWDTHGDQCLIGLHKIANFIFKSSLSLDGEIQLEKALGSYHVPVKMLRKETEMEYGEQVRDITRKYFLYLLRYKSYEKAFSLAIDINDEDLFMDLFNCAKCDGIIDLAADAYHKAEEILLRSDSPQSLHSLCSHSSCSDCKEDHKSIVDDNSKASSQSKPLSNVQEKFTQPHDIIPKISAMAYSNNNNNNNQTNSISQHFIGNANVQIPSHIPRLHSISNTTTNNNNNNNNLAIKLSAPPTLTTNSQYSDDPRYRNLHLYRKHLSSNNNNHNNNSKLRMLSKNSSHILLDDISYNSNNNNNNHNNNRHLISDNNTIIHSSNPSEISTVVMPNILPRITFPYHPNNNQQHIVIDVFPKPNVQQQHQQQQPPQQQQQQQSGIQMPFKSNRNIIPDQTIGIPMVVPQQINTLNSHPPLITSSYANTKQYQSSSSLMPLPSSAFLPHPHQHPSTIRLLNECMFTKSDGNLSSAAFMNSYNNNNNNNNNNKNVNNNIHQQQQQQQQIIHQYPLVSGNIPPLSMASAALLTSASTPSAGQFLQSQQNHTTEHFLYNKKPTSMLSSTSIQHKLLKDKPINFTNSILTTSQSTNQQTNTNNNNNNNNLSSNQTAIASGSSGGGGEKNKVKFSDTVTVAVVPEIPRKEKSIIDRIKRSNGYNHQHPQLHHLHNPSHNQHQHHHHPQITTKNPVTNPQKELADSLPLCHPNDDYLKDFTPMPLKMDPHDGNNESSTTQQQHQQQHQQQQQQQPQSSTTNRNNSSAIKVVHFGVV